MKLLFNIAFALLGFAAIILEFFVPSAGIIGLIGAGFVIAGIVFTYMNLGVLAGTIFLVACAIIGPIIMFLYFKIFPNSYIGKKLILNHQSPNNDTNHGDLINNKGITDTTLRPIGYAIINKKRYNVTTLGEFIDKDSKIKVLKIEGYKIIVAQEESL